MRNNLFYMLDKKSMKEKYSHLKGIGKTKNEFYKKRRSKSMGVNQLKTEVMTKENSLNPNLKKMKMPRLKGKRSVSLSKKVRRGKNRLLGVIETKNKLKPVFRSFNKIDRRIDASFYPNPEYVIHPSKKIFFSEIFLKFFYFFKSGQMFPKEEIVQGNRV